MKKQRNISGPLDTSFPRGNDEKGMIERHQFLEQKGNSLEWIKKSPYPSDLVKGNTENYIGLAGIPIGLAGPLPIKGDHAEGDFFVPLATTEGSLVASYNRGMMIIKESGGCRVKIFEDHMQRAPGFRFKSLEDAAVFSRWIESNRGSLEKSAAQTTSHGKLTDVDIFNLGRIVYVRFGFDTGDAAGQNMVNLATHRICKDIKEAFPHWDRLESFNLGSKFCCDKKYAQINILKSRGKKVSAEVEIPHEVLKTRLRTSAESINDMYLDGTLSALYSGCISNGFHAANGIAALFIACGNDPANVAESHMDIMDLRITEKGLYFSITLPSLIVGTIGGGTNLPTQNECLNVLGCKGSGKSKKFAEIAAAVVLAGEISLMGAISSDEWVGAHEKFGRNRE